VKKAQPRLSSPFLHNIHQHLTGTAVSHSWVSLLRVLGGKLLSSPCHSTGVLLSLVTRRTFPSTHDTGHGFPGAPSASRLQIIMAVATAHWQGFQEIQEAKSNRNATKAKKANTTPETTQNADSAFIYHSKPNIVLVMSRSPHKCWA